MIQTALNKIKTELTEQLNAMFGGDCTVSLSALNKDGAQNDGDILITLVHIEEETFAKQPLPYLYQEGENGKKALSNKYKNPELNVNLYLLFSAQHEKYETALHHISAVLQFFQSENKFNIGTKESEKISLSLELYPFTLEQNINLWQSVGCKLMPSALYKVRMITIQSSEIQNANLINNGVIRYPYDENGENKEEKTILNIKQ